MKRKRETTIKDLPPEILNLISKYGGTSYFNPRTVLCISHVRIQVLLSTVVILATTKNLICAQASRVL